MKFDEEVFEFKWEYDLVKRAEHDKLRDIYEECMKLEMGDIFVTLLPSPFGVFLFFMLFLE